MTNLSRVYDLGNPIDEQATGFSARVCLATHWDKEIEVAFKVMRPQYVGDIDVWKRFNTEAHLLELFANDIRVVDLLDCGYVSDTRFDFPQQGEIESFQTDVNTFIQQSTAYKDRSWRPYLTLARKPPKHCLLSLLRGPQGDGFNPFRLTTEEGMSLAIQFTGFLLAAHQMNVVYLDHKPEHVYWDGNQLCIIDLNVSLDLRQENNLTPASIEKYKRTDLRNFMAGVLFTIFTGRDARFQNLARAPVAHPSAPQEVARRFDGIELDFGMEDTLLPDLVSLINHGMDIDIPMAAQDFLDGLEICAARIGWDRPKHPPTNEARRAREQICIGLEALRDAQASLDKAYQAFDKAYREHPANRESLRLKEKTKQFQYHRVLP